MLNNHAVENIVKITPFLPLLFSTLGSRLCPPFQGFWGPEHGLCPASSRGAVSARTEGQVGAAGRLATCHAQPFTRDHAMFMKRVSSSSVLGPLKFISVHSLSMAHTTDGTAQPQLTLGKGRVTHPQAVDQPAPPRPAQSPMRLLLVMAKSYLLGFRVSLCWLAGSKVQRGERERTMMVTVGLQYNELIKKNLG